MKIKDEEIISLMKNEITQERGMKMMMKEYQSRLYWHIRRLISDDDTAKDILQETFIKAYQNFFQFKKDLKKNVKLQRIGEDVEVYLEKEMVNEGIKNADEIQDLLLDAIQKLPEKQKLVFSMRYYDDLPYEEISKIVDMSVSTLKTNYHYAKEKIEQYILKNSEDF